MTREEAKKYLMDISFQIGTMGIEYLTEKDGEKMREAIKALEQEPCEDEYIKVPKKALKYRTAGMVAYNAEWLKNNFDIERAVICGAQEQKTRHCKDCKHFEYDSVAKVDGVPLIVAHEICSRWGNGCKTKENGYCFLFEPQESEVNNG